MRAVVSPGVVMMSLGVVLGVMGASSCRESERAAPVADRDRPQRKIEPPSRKVRPLPPHAIRADGVGPYRLGVSLEELARQLPSGPRIATLDIPNVVHLSILEDEAPPAGSILIGGELGRASFVAVVGGEIARTESGVHVGSSRAELERALGAPVRDLGRAHDPRIVEPSGLRPARFVMDDDRVAGIVVLADAPSASKPADGCARPDPDEPQRFGACLSGAGEVVTVDGDALAVRAVDSDRVLDEKHLPGLVFAVPLRGWGEAHDELIAITRTTEPNARSWTLVAYRFEGSKLARVGDPTLLYQLSASAARWIGAELNDLDLYLELSAGSDSLEVGGLLSTRIGDKLRDLVVISPVPPIPRRRARPTTSEATDAGASDASR